jgi:hypothetical protein
MTALAAPRRDRFSLWETVALLRAAGGAAPSIAPILLLITFVAAAPAFGVLILGRAPSPSARFFVIASLLIPISAMVTVLFEVRRIAALAFLRTIPQPYAPRSLVLLPMCGLGTLAAVASLSVLPPLAAVALLGCWCWASSIGHRFAGRGGWPLLLVAVPLAYVALLAAAVSLAAGGFAALAAVSTALGLGGCVASPRDGFLALVAPGSAPIASRGGQGPRRTTTRIFQVALRANPRGLGDIGWVAIAIAGICLLGLIVSSSMNALPASLGFQIAIASRLASVNSRATREFLLTRPLSRWVVLRALVIPSLLLGLFAPTIAALAAATKTAAARDAVLRVALLQLAFFWSFAAFAVADARKERGRKRWTGVVLFLVAAALMVPAILPWLRLPWALPPFWLGGALAVAGGAELRRRLAVPD